MRTSIFLTHKIYTILLFAIMALTPLFTQDNSQMTFIEGNVIACNGCLGGPVGCPIPGANIDAVPLNSATDEAYTTNADENGHFALEVPVGAYSVTCSQTGWENQTQTIEVGYNGSAIEFCLTEVQDLEVVASGHVYGNYYPDQNNAEPLHNATVYFQYYFASDIEPSLLLSQQTDENGYFEFYYPYDSGWTGDYDLSHFTLSVQAEGYYNAEMTFEYNNAPITHNFFLTPNVEPTDVIFSGTVSGSFNDMLPAFIPLEGALVEVISGTASGVYDVIFETETNHDGYFQFLNNVNTPFPEEAQVRVSKDGYSTVEEWFDFHELPVTHDFYLNHITDPYPTTTVFGHVSAQLSPMGPVFPIGGAVIGATPSWGDAPYYETETNENGWFELELEDSAIGNVEWLITCFTDYGTQTQTFLAYPGEENEVNFHFNAWDEPVLQAPYNLTVELVQDANQWEPTAILNWEYPPTDDFNLPVSFNIYAQYGGPNGPFVHTGITDVNHFEMMIGGFVGYNGCFYVTATLNGLESEPSNTACVEGFDPEPVCEDLSGISFGDCEMIIGIGWNGEECTWFSGCGTVSEDGVDYSNAFFDSVEECEVACGIEDDGPPECIMDCPSFEDIDPNENADIACEWIIDTVTSDSECISDCDDYTLEMLSEVSWACEMCLAGEFECEDIFNDDDPHENGVIYGMVEYVWGDAIELVAGAHIVITGISSDGTVEDVYETETNEQGMYEIEVPVGSYHVTCTAYEETETIEAFVEAGHEVQVNFQFGEFYFPTAITGMVYGELEMPEPIDDAHLTIHYDNGIFLETWTNEGWYWLDLPGAGEYYVSIEAEGYFPEDINFFAYEGINEMDFYLTPIDDYMDPEATFILGNASITEENEVIVPLYLHSEVDIAGLQFAVWPEQYYNDFYLMPSGLESMNDCFTANWNEVYGQLWGIMFSLEGCVFEAYEEHHVANLAFSSEGFPIPGLEIPLVFNETIASDPDGNEIQSEGIGTIVTFGMQGDINADGAINVMDIVQLVNFVLNIDEPTDYEFWAGDVNVDGTLNVIDVVQIVNIILYDDEMGSAGRLENGEARLQYNQHSIIIQGSNIAGFQIEFEGELQRPQLPMGWEFVSSGSIAIAYSLQGVMINEPIQIAFNGEVLSAIISDSNGSSIPVLMDEIPESTTLQNAYPNPFNPTTTIGFTIDNGHAMTLQIFNINGQMVQSLVDGFVEAGFHEVVWDATNFSSGVYLIHMATPNQAFTQKLMLVK
jgi:hypothetical protein